MLMKKKLIEDSRTINSSVSSIRNLSSLFPFFSPLSSARFLNVWQLGKRAPRGGESTRRCQTSNFSLPSGPSVWVGKIDRKRRVQSARESTHDDGSLTLSRRADSYVGGNKTTTTRGECRSGGSVARVSSRFDEKGIRGPSRDGRVFVFSSHDVR